MEYHLFYTLLYMCDHVFGWQKSSTLGLSKEQKSYLVGTVVKYIAYDLKILTCNS